MLVVDSSVLIAHLRGRRKVTDFLRREAARDPVLVPALAAWELWKGAGTARQRDAVRSLLSALPGDPFTPAMAELAGDVHRTERKRGAERPAYDLLIASHALHHGCPLATMDRDYESVHGLEVVRIRG